MNKTKLSDAEKKKIIKEILGANHNAVGKHFPIFSSMMDGLSNINDAASFAELIPALEGWLSGTIASSVISTASFAGTLLFPFQQMINLINANETGLRGYSYRSISYTITAWAFDKPKPTSSPQILSNSRSGPYVTTRGVEEYHKIWRETPTSVLTQINQICSKRNIKKNSLKEVFKALGKGRPDMLSVLILKGFENQFSTITKNIWASNYSIAYPR